MDGFSWCISMSSSLLFSVLENPIVDHEELAASVCKFMSWNGMCVANVLPFNYKTFHSILKVSNLHKHMYCCI